MLHFQDVERQLVTSEAINSTIQYQKTQALSLTRVLAKIDKVSAQKSAHPLSVLLDRSEIMSPSCKSSADTRYKSVPPFPKLIVIHTYLDTNVRTSRFHATNSDSHMPLGPRAAVAQGSKQVFHFDPERPPSSPTTACHLAVPAALLCRIVSLQDTRLTLVREKA
jgi:hypothetical protein